jgi:hypothetical protein
VVKDETRYPPKKYLQLATADSVLGGFGTLGAPITAEGLWVEGPTGIQIGDETLIYYDAYTSHRYGAKRSKDLVNWEDVSAQIHFPDEDTAERVRHGTVIKIPVSLLQTLNSQSKK